MNSSAVLPSSLTLSSVSFICLLTQITTVHLQRAGKPLRVQTLCLHSAQHDLDRSCRALAAHEINLSHQMFPEGRSILREQTPMILREFRMFFHKNCPVCCIDSFFTLAWQCCILVTLSLTPENPGNEFWVHFVGCWFFLFVVLLWFLFLLSIVFLLISFNSRTFI